jgi:hypothetical protein
MAMKRWTIGIALYALTTAVAAANPVLNGNFESGDLSEGATPKRGRDADGLDCHAQRYE